MKRVLYIFLAVGLAASLVGCGGGSNGGYWPMNPTAPAGVPLGGPIGGVAAVPAVFGVGAAGLAANGAVANQMAGVTGCPVLFDFASMPFSLSTGALPTNLNVLTSVLGGSRSRKVSQAISGLNLANDGGWVKLTYNPKSATSASVAFEAKLEYWVRFLNSSGEALTFVATTTADAPLYSFSGGKTQADVDSIEWYGNYEIKTSCGHTEGVSCSVIEEYSSPAHVDFEYSVQSMFGSRETPNVVTKLVSAAQPGGVAHQKFNARTSVSGTYDGQSTNTSFMTELGGEGTHGKYAGLFGNVLSYGNGFYRSIDQDGNVIEMKAYQSYFEWYTNGKLTYSNKPTSSGQPTCQIK